MPWVRPVSFESHQALQRIILEPVVKALDLKMGFATSGAHDIKNLFISDGSQFTTSAAANPTLTIVALAIRQADYIADQWQSTFDESGSLRFANATSVFELAKVGSSIGLSKM